MQAQLFIFFICVRVPLV